jgi:hypothetical protein
MSPFAHALSASWIALTVAHVAPTETPYIVAALAAATVLDLDHVILLIRDQARFRRHGYQGNLHHARSVLHELLGLCLAGALAAGLYAFNPKLALVIFIAFAIHLAQDWLVGKSFPLSPIDKTEIRFFAPTIAHKVILDVAVVVAFGGLWIPYLLGRL